MTDLICLDCNNYDFPKEYCRKLHTIIPSTDESGCILTCVYHTPIIQYSVKQGDIFWGKDEHTNDKWWMCCQCHTWWKEKDGHICTAVIPKEPPFISEKEMEI